MVALGAVREALLDRLGSVVVQEEDEVLAACGDWQTWVDGERVGAAVAAQRGSKVQECMFRAATRHVESSAAAGCDRRPVSEGAAAPAATRLVAFVASHVGSAARVGRLSRLLASVAAQRAPVEGVFISWSAATEALARDAAAVFERFEGRIPGLVASRHPEAAASQFAHFRRLAEAQRDAPDAWVLFSDDDDVWHDGRAEAYEAAVAAAAATNAAAVACLRLARPKGRAATVCDARAVDAAVALGAAGASCDYDEYFCYCARRRALDAFFRDAATDDLVESQYCDLAWYRFLTTRHEVVLFRPADDANWLYLYDAPPAAAAAADGGRDGASSRVAVGERHRAVAARVVAANPGAAPPADVVARVLATRDNAAELYCASHAGAPTALLAEPFLADGRACVEAQLASLGVFPRALLDWLRPSNADALKFAAANFGLAFQEHS